MSAKNKDGIGSEKKGERKRRVVSFPTIPFDQPRAFAEALFRTGAGQPVRRLTLFDAIGKAPESGPSRSLVSASSKYGLTKGSASAEFIELTEDGRKVVDDGFDPKVRAIAKVDCAISTIPAFLGLYEKFKGNKLPAKSVLVDAVQEFDIDREIAEQAVDIFLENMQEVNLLQTLSGAERIVSKEHLADGVVSDPSFQSDTSRPTSPATFAPPITSGQAALETTAFYVTPIGSDGSVQRKHSDLFLNTLIEPAVERFGLKVVRADQIDKPGVITKQVIQYLVEARLVIADLSFHNPNVFYELAIRHMVRKPVVQIIQKSDNIPFDVNQLRTIPIDNTDIYTWTPKLELWRSEISNQIRQALDDPSSSDSPVNWYFDRQSLNS
ncbi:PqqD family protein [Loktanella sp. 3ANDIMAR09]|uniref:PqqD family protein n=1 Tax=Loktanella sp. 3ANDIMAR09 TaxID=1225657 RepID=UPI0009F863AA|nr:PqqD family protein [Loktanella sp. 3ANDIMAR09]